MSLPHPSSPPASPPGPHDVVVLSDLHLGRGRNPRTGRFHSLEAFFFDDDFHEFCRHLCAEAEARGNGLTVVLNGDTFDFLRIEPEEPGPDASRRERRYGPMPTPDVAANMLRDVLGGHPRFVAALALLLRAGHRVVFLPGNHDVELQWRTVKDVLREKVLAAVALEAGEEVAAECAGRLTVDQWFYYEPGRLWVEHGCQYDRESSFRYYLRGPAEDRPEALRQLERDLPLGSFLQRYLYNAFGAITFIVPSTAANLRYARWLVTNRPGLLLRVLATHLPFGLQLIRRLAKLVESPAELERAHQEELATLAQRSGLGPKLHEVDGLKDVLPSLAQAVRAVVVPGAKLGIIGVVLVLAGAGIWFSLFNLILQLELGFGLKALVFLVSNVVMVLILLLGLTYALIRQPPDVHPRPLRRAAQQIAELLGVDVVTFGHTHDEVLWPLERSSGEAAWYFNTGTWITTFTHDTLIPREKVQYSFLRVRGRSGELLQWSPGRGRPVPVILLDE